MVGEVLVWSLPACLSGELKERDRDTAAAAAVVVRVVGGDTFEQLGGRLSVDPCERVGVGVGVGVRGWGKGL